MDVATRAFSRLDRVVTEHCDPRVECQLSRGEYDARRAMNGSLLVHGAKSMLHLWDAAQTPWSESPAMLVGRAAHTMILEPHLWDQEWVVWEGGRRFGKDWEGFKAENEGKSIISLDEYDRVQGMRLGVARNTIATRLLSGLTCEASFMAHLHGMRFKGRMDGVDLEQHTIVDLKTTRSVDVREFSRSFCNLRYDLKLSLYRDLYTAATGERPKVFIIAVESEHPHDCVAIPILDHPVLDYGAESAAKIARRVLEAQELGVWHGVGGCTGLVDLAIPNWHMPEEW